MFMEETSHPWNGVSSLWKGFMSYTRDTGIQCQDVSFQ